MRKHETLFIIMFILCSMYILSVHAQDTGDTGFSAYSDTGEAGFSDDDLASMTSEEIAENIDYVEDITKLDEYALNRYVETYYGSSISMEHAITGATLSEDGELINGDTGSRIKLTEIPEGATIILESDGSITIYPEKDGDEVIDYYTLLEDNQGDGESRPPLTIITGEDDISFADGTVLQKNSELVLLSENEFYLSGTMEYNGMEVISRSGPLIVLIEDSSDLDKASAKLKKIQLPSTGKVIITPSSLFITGKAQVIIREAPEYGVGKDQGMVFLSQKNGGILYDASQETPTLKLYGSATVFNGVRVLEFSDDKFYSFRGGWKEGSEDSSAAKEVRQYNGKLKDVYGYLPKKTVPMDIEVYTSRDFNTPTESYEIRSEELYDKLGTPDLYVANYLLDPSFDTVPKEKAVILWSSRGSDITGDRPDFVKVVETKKQQLIAQGYAEEDIVVKEFTSQEEYFEALDKTEDATYVEIVSHGWVGSDGGNIGTQQYYEAPLYDVPEEVQVTYPITSKDMSRYLQAREEKVTAGEAKPLFNQRGAYCTISTCHSAAYKSYYDPAQGVVPVVSSDIAPPMAQTIKQQVGNNVHVYGTIGPLYLVGEKDASGRWVKTFIPVTDSTQTFEGTKHPSMDDIYEQDVGYYEI
ncbi:MAG: hypothetical protein AABX82_01025 [Nanoarchaeota archaeon]